MPRTQLAIRDNEYDDVADDVSLRECGYDDYIWGDVYDNEGEDKGDEENDEDDYDVSP